MYLLALTRDIPTPTAAKSMFPSLADDKPHPPKRTRRAAEARQPLGAGSLASPGCACPCRIVHAHLCPWRRRVDGDVEKVQCSSACTHVVKCQLAMPAGTYALLSSNCDTEGMLLRTTDYLIDLRTKDTVKARWCYPNRMRC